MRSPVTFKWPLFHFENNVTLFTIRLDSDGNIKVGGFGLAEDVYSCGYFRQEDIKNIRLPYKWMALESLAYELFSEKTDVVRNLDMLILQITYVCPIASIIN